MRILLSATIVLVLATGCTSGPSAPASSGRGTPRADPASLVASVRAAGKTGNELDVQPLRDPQVQDLRDQHLFAYLDDHGEAHPVSSTDVNDYIKQATGGDFTAKNFRTWGATLIAFEALAHSDDDLTLKTLLAPVVEQLGNTPAIARKSYVHPAVVALVDRQIEWRQTLKLPRKTRWMSREERGLLALLEASPPAEELLAAAA